MEDIAITERQFADKTAAEYRSRGYEVFREVQLDFWPGARADLLVCKDGENKVIEVKTRTSLAVTPELEELAEALNSKPGWSFDLLLVGEPERLDTPHDARPFAEENITKRIAQAECALAADLAEAAFLLAWSACEAAVRVLVTAAGVEIKRATQSGYILGHAVFQGAISGNDDKYLSDMLAYRNAIVHGFEVNDFSVERAKELVVAAKRLHRACAKAEQSNEERAGRFDLLDPLDVPARLEELYNVQDGWTDWSGLSTDRGELDWLAGSFESYYPDDVPLPNTFSTPEGGIQMEWSVGTNDVMLRIDLKSKRGEWFSFNRDSDDELEHEFNLDAEDNWLLLASQVRQVSEVLI